MFMKYFRNKKRGSLLIEALLAIVILSVSLTAIIRAIVSAARAGSYSKDYTIAMMLAEDKMFEITREAIQDFDQHKEGRFKAPFEDYSYQLKSKEVLGKNVDNLYEAELTVKWGREGRQKRVSVTTFVIDPPQEES